MRVHEERRLHDAEVLALEIDRLGGVARMSFRKEDGTMLSAELQGLKAFRCEDMTLQNVVSRLLRSSKGQFTKEDLEHWLQWATSLSDASSWLSAGRKQEWLDACQSGGLELVVVEPSAGAQIAALCERVVLDL